MGRHADEHDWSNKAVFSTGEAAQICNVSQQTIIRCFDSGRLQGFRVPGSKFRRIPREELIRFMRANDIPVGLIEGKLRRLLCVCAPPSPIELLTHQLADRAWLEIRSAECAFDAGMQAVAFKPHLILVDQQIRGVSVSLLRDRFTKLRLSGVPAVVYVGRFKAGQREERLRAGAAGVIELPMTDTELAKAVLEWIDRAEGNGDG